MVLPSGGLAGDRSRTTPARACWPPGSRSPNGSGGPPPGCTPALSWSRPKLSSRLLQRAGLPAVVPGGPFLSFGGSLGGYPSLGCLGGSPSRQPGIFWLSSRLVVPAGARSLSTPSESAPAFWRPLSQGTWGSPCRAHLSLAVGAPQPLHFPALPRRLCHSLRLPRYIWALPFSFSYWWLGFSSPGGLVAFRRAGGFPAGDRSLSTPSESAPATWRPLSQGKWGPLPSPLPLSLAAPDSNLYLFCSCSPDVSPTTLLPDLDSPAWHALRCSGSRCPLAACVPTP